MNQPRTILHIGTPKSGTTYLQAKIEANPDQVKADGFRWAGGSWDAQVNAVGELRGLGAGEQPGALWQGLLDDVAAHPDHDALVSMEWLCTLRPHQIEAAVASLPGEVHVIVTVRGLQRNVISQWQEMTRNFRPWTWEHYLASIRDVDPESSDACARTFWRQQDAVDIIERWSAVVPAERISIVTVPPAGSDPGVLWRRWCQVLGVDPDAYEEPARDNASTGVVSSVLMQRLNVVAARRSMGRGVYHPLMHTVVARRELPRRSREEGGIRLDDDTAAWVATQAQRQAEGLERTGVRVVGELADVTAGPKTSGRDPREVTDAELFDTCADVFVTVAARQFRTLRQRDARIAELEAELAQARRRRGLRRWIGAVGRRMPGPVKRAIPASVKRRLVR